MQYFKKIAEEFGFNLRSVTNILLAKRRGFESLTKYQDYLAVMKGYESRSSKQYGTTIQKKFEEDILFCSPEQYKYLCTDDLKQIIEQKDLINRLIEIIKHLPETERYILETKYGLNGKSQKSMEQIGSEIGITKQAISLRYKKAIQKLIRISKHIV